MKRIFSNLIFISILLISCNSNSSNKTENKIITSDIPFDISNNLERNILFDYNEEFCSDNFFKSKDKSCPLYLTIANEGSSVFGYFFINDKSNSTKLIPFFIDDYGRIFHEENNYKINSINKLEDGTYNVNITESKRKLFFKSKKDKEHIFVRNTNDDFFIKNRYESEVFENYIVIDDIKYGSAVGYWTNYASGGNDDNYMEIIKNRAKELVRSQKKLSLLMDIYYPENDYIDKRPLIMMIHGGGFFIGDKKNDFMQDMCPYLARCGYTVASIDYRLGYIPSQSNIDRIGYQALQDARAAMRYLVAHADKYGIDTSRIYVGGTSAGAITSLNLAFMEEEFIPASANGGFFKTSLGGLDESGNKLKEEFDVKAVINMWGAVHDSAMISPNKDVALLSIHGDADMVVPIEYANPFLDVGKVAEWLTNKLCGSKIIHRRAHAHNYSAEKLIVIPDGGHGPIYDDKNNLNENYFMIKDEMTIFLHELNKRNLNDISLEDLNIHFTNNQIQISPNKDVISDYYINVVGGCITTDKRNNYRTIWFSNVSEKYYEFHITNNIGANKTLKLYVN